MPGRMKRCVSATSAVSVRRGSTTTRRPPRAFSALRRSGIPGAVIMLPFEASGLAPRARKNCVRSMSGIGRSSMCPNIVVAARWCGSWSTDVAE